MSDYEESSFQSFRQWFRESNTVKFATIGVLILLLLYPVGLVSGLISEREQARDQVVRELSSKWGGEQAVAGPVLTVPFEVRTEIGENQYTTRMVKAHFLPKALNVDGTLDAKTRYRSIYEVLLYGSTLSFSGHFEKPDFEKLNVGTGRIRWDRAYVSLGLSDLTGIRDPIELTIGGATHEFEPGLPDKQVLSSGVSVPVDLGEPRAYGPNAPEVADSDETLAFEFDVKLNGRKKLHVVPVGKNTKMHLESDHGTPSFDGAFLPDSRTIDENHFSADWSVLDLNRSFPQQWIKNEYDISASSFGVQLLVPVDHYQKADRSVKYALLFIVLTFTVFFFAEVLNDNRIHPIQYMMVGGGLCVFYILLVAISEHIGFNLAFLIASTGVIGLITGYSKSVLRDGALTTIVGTALVALYVFLFTVLQLEMYALLIGSIGLFVVLGAVMYLSRNVNWYRAMSRDGNV